MNVEEKASGHGEIFLAKMPTGSGTARDFAPEQRIEVEGFSSGGRLGPVYDLADAAKELERDDSWKTQVDAMGPGWPH